jgi:uncharacterized YccA/Bax inhibitor family protein
MSSGNPVFSQSMLERVRSDAVASGRTMTVQGTSVKTLILLGLCFGAACFTWTMVGRGDLAAAGVWIGGGAITGLVLCLATCFVPRWAPFTAPLYAFAEGLFLGGFSAYLETRFPGIALQGVAATFGVMFALLMAYSSGLIRATQSLRMGIAAATFGIMIVYLASFVLSFFGTTVPYIHEAGWIGIGFSVFVVGIAAFNLILDFDDIESAARSGAPKSMEWYGAFGLMVTLVWLYIEVVRLLAKLYSSRE